MPQSLAAGTSVGHCTVVEPLGTGGMGEGYKATDTRLDRTVAIKVLPAALASDPEPSTGSGSSRAKPRDDRRERFLIRKRSSRRTGWAARPED